MLLQQGFRRFGAETAAVGYFQQDVTRATGQAGGAAAQWAGQANVVVILALQPEQGGAAGILRGADADLAVDLSAIELSDLLFVGFPLGWVALAFQRFVRGEAGAAGEQGDKAEYE